MKLAAGIIASLATVGEAAITCSNNKELFEVTCNVATGFTIKINEGCRQSHFSMVDFANSFVWGNSAVMQMATPTGDTANDVVAAATCNDGTNDQKIKPASTTSVLDSDQVASFNWPSIPLNDCGISPQQLTDGTTGNEYLAYDLYWNSQFADAQLASQLMYQIGQVKFRCRIDPYQEDAGSITISEDTSIADPADQRVDIAAGLELQVNKLEFDVASPLDEATLTATAVNADAGTPVYGQASVSYTTATDAKLGDYMELKLADKASSGVLAAYAVSLTKCWASNNADTAVDNTNGGTQTGTWFADTNPSSTADQFVFFDEFCPLYPDWVAPNGAAGYLKETWDRASSLHAVHFRQFGFANKQAQYLANSANHEIYYHCFVKVCDKAAKTTCSTTTLSGTANTCSATAFTNPSRKRRGTTEGNGSDIASTKISVESGCDDTLGVKCLRSSDSDSGSSAVEATATLAAVSLAMLH